MCFHSILCVSVGHKARLFSICKLSGALTIMPSLSMINVKKGFISDMPCRQTTAATITPIGYEHCHQVFQFKNLFILVYSYLNIIHAPSEWWYSVSHISALFLYLIYIWTLIRGLFYFSGVICGLVWYWYWDEFIRWLQIPLVSCPVRSFASLAPLRHKHTHTQPC